MNRVRAHIIGYTLLLIMLFSMSGVSIHKMTCRTSGNSVVSVGEFDGTCCAPQKSNSISEKCCDNSSAYVHVTEFERTDHTNFQVTPVVLMTVVSMVETIGPERLKRTYQNKAPPRVECCDRTFTGVFRL